MYVVFPSVSMVVLSTFQPCYELEDGTKYMPNDFSTRCGSSDHSNILLLGSLLALLFPIGVPLFFFILLRSSWRMISHYQELTKNRNVALADIKTIREGRESLDGSTLHEVQMAASVRLATLGVMIDDVKELVGRGRNNQRKTKTGMKKKTRGAAQKKCE